MHADVIFVDEVSARRLGSPTPAFPSTSQMAYLSESLSPLPPSLLAFMRLHLKIKSTRCSQSNVAMSISVVDIRIRASRWSPCKQLRMAFFM